MKRATAAAFLFVIGLLASSAAFSQSYQATIDQAQEVPPSGSPALGLGCFDLQPNGMLDYEISYAGLTAAETGAHIHAAPAGVNGGVIFPLPLGTPKIGSVGPLSAADITALNSAGLYVNIHSQNFTGGEIRGQILTGPQCSIAVAETSWSNVKTLYKQP